MTGDQYALTSSSLIRQVVSLGGNVDQLSAVLPTNVVSLLKKKQRGGMMLPIEPDTPAT
jgi:pantetheine-phosphate adenylyltransferase